MGKDDDLPTSENPLHSAGPPALNIETEPLTPPLQSAGDPSVEASPMKATVDWGTPYMKSQQAQQQPPGIQLHPSTPDRFSFGTPDLAAQQQSPEIVEPPTRLPRSLITSIQF